MDKEKEIAELKAQVNSLRNALDVVSMYCKIPPAQFQASRGAVQNAFNVLSETKEQCLAEHDAKVIEGVKNEIMQGLLSKDVSAFEFDEYAQKIREQSNEN